MGKHAEITTTFSVLLILYSATQGLIACAFSSATKGFPIEGMVLLSLLDFGRYLLMTFVSAYFAREIGNRLITDLFDHRFLAATTGCLSRSHPTGCRIGMVGVLIRMHLPFFNRCASVF